MRGGDPGALTCSFPFAELLRAHLKLLRERADIAMMLLKPGGEIVPLRQRQGDAFHLQVNQGIHASGIFADAEAQIQRPSVGAIGTDEFGRDDDVVRSAK